MALPRILFAWEMGENYGHIDKIMAIVRALDGRAEVFAAVREPIALRRLAPDMDLRLLAAPHAPVAKPHDATGTGACFPDVLRWCGWQGPQALAALLESWRTLFELVNPDVVVGQSAPTALLATRGGPWRTALLGYGYDAPPRATPMPPLRWWKPGEAERAAKAEARVLSDANTALDHLGMPRMQAFRDSMDVDRYLLASFAELDHYGDRSRWEPDHEPYLGQLFETSAGVELDWRGDARYRIFAYLRPQRPGFAQALEVFAAPSPDWDIIFAAPGIVPSDAARLSAAGVQVVDGPIRLDRLLPRCSLGIHHASNGTTNALLVAGVPQVGLPTHTEQMMCARALADAGLGAGMGGRYDAVALRGVIERVLSQPKILSSTKAAAQRIVERHPLPVAPQIAETLLDLAAAER